MGPRMIIPTEDIFASRSTIINWKNHLSAIVDGYRECHSITHGVQKDAVQNAWDARINKHTGADWHLEFKLIKGGKGYTYLTITDSGTTGLTGRVLSSVELQEDLPPEERWGRFENVAFTKAPEEEALGARGRGKFIFVGASENLTILYDTLKPDGTYRFGFRVIELTDSKVNSFDDDSGREKLKQYTNGNLEPLSVIGTRVIIVNPISEMVDAINSGDFLRYIEETWWETIKKHGVKISIVTPKNIEVAKIPKELKLYENDSSSVKTWTKNNISIRAGGDEYRIKRLHFVCNLRGPVPEDIRGVSIQRGGLKVCSIQIPYVSGRVLAQGRPNCDRND